MKYSEKDIIDACKNGDSSAMEQIYNTYSAKMRKVCFRYTGNIDDANDCLQDTFIKLFENISKYQVKENVPLEVWILRIFVNNCINYLKKKKIFLSFDEVVEKETNTDNEENHYEEENKNEILNNLSLDEIMNAVNSIKEEYRIIFNLHAIEGYKHKEISEILNISVINTNVKYLRARKMIEKILLEKVNKKKWKLNIT